MNRFFFKARKVTFPKTIIYLFIPLLIFFILFIVVYKIYCSEKLNSNDISFLITTIKDLFNILFFGGVLSITILSYLQAKKSLFTPIKTETFKMQIKAFEEILLFFQNKRESDFIDQFDLNNIIKINAQLLQLDFIRHFFSNEIQIDEQKVNELEKKISGSIISKNYLEKNFTKLEYHEREEKKEKAKITNPAIILKQWNDYEYGKIDFTNKFKEETQKLKNLSASPILPEEIKDLINKFERKIHTNLSLVGKILTEISKELPTKFPNAKSLQNFNNLGIWNIYNSRMDTVENDAEEILRYIRKYLKIDDLIN
ncbi:hypothetical protein [Flavobacterium chungangensis]|uniref:Phage abortive infection protein n=1 Tax=Flavobacterium chungangensis TaxID=2708132 RepID=A0ABV8ZEM7_9FLAO